MKYVSLRTYYVSMVKISNNAQYFFGNGEWPVWAAIGENIPSFAAVFKRRVSSDKYTTDFTDNELIGVWKGTCVVVVRTIVERLCYEANSVLQKIL